MRDLENGRNRVRSLAKIATITAMAFSVIQSAGVGVAPNLKVRAEDFVVTESGNGGEKSSNEKQAKPPEQGGGSAAEASVESKPESAPVPVPAQSGRKSDGADEEHVKTIEVGISGEPLTQEQVKQALSEIEGPVKVKIVDGVTEIAKYAFNSDYRDPKSISIPPHVVCLRGFSRDCRNLISITIPESVKKIGERAFHGCCGLTSIDIPSSVAEIHGGAFSNCSSLTLITIPSSVIEIEPWTFAGCSSLTSMKIPYGVTKIGGAAFRGCSRLFEIEIPESVMEIGVEAFKDCSSLESTLTIPSNVRVIGTETFEGCKNLKSVIFKGQKLESIGFSAFKDCILLTDITIPKSVEKIDSFAFENCISLESMEIPENVTEISYGTYRGCCSLTRVEVHERVRKVDKAAFEGCNSLVKISFEGKELLISADAFKDCVNLERPEFPEGCDVTLIIGAGSGGMLTREQVEQALSIFNNPVGIVVDENVRMIDNMAFADCNSLKSVKISCGLFCGTTEIGDWVFNGCNELTSVEIPCNVAKIGENSFSTCDKLKKIIFKTTFKGFLPGTAPVEHTARVKIDVHKHSSRFREREGKLTRNFVQLVLSKVKLPIDIVVSQGPAFIEKEVFAGYGDLVKVEVPSSVN